MDLLITSQNFSFMTTNSVETALSDDHHMIYTFLKTKFEKFEPKKLIYRNLKQFDIDEFKFDIYNGMSAKRTLLPLKTNLLKFQINTLLRKQKFLRWNQKPHFDKNLRKQIMTRLRLEHTANNSKNPSVIVKFKRQRNLVPNLNE